MEVYCEKYGPEHVLLVCDLDNTLMAMNHPLGSDQWFEWQRYLIDHDPKSPYRVADTFPGLLDAQGVLYNLGRMHPTQPDLPELMGKAAGSRDIDARAHGPRRRVPRAHGEGIQAQRL